MPGHAKVKQIFQNTGDSKSTLACEVTFGNLVAGETFVIRRKGEIVYHGTLPEVSLLKTKYSEVPYVCPTCTHSHKEFGLVVNHFVAKENDLVISLEPGLVVVQRVN